MPPKKKKTIIAQTSNVTALTDEQNMGILTAKTLLAEINAPERGPSAKDNDLKDEVPTRQDLSFVIKNGEDFAKIDLNLFNENDTTGIKKYGSNAICLSSGFIGKKGLFDIDHCFPFKRIKEKQEQLLKHLKDNDKFAKAFMGEKPLDLDIKEKIGEYFGRDPTTHEIKGKWRFFRACYNDKDNLILLARNINSSKSVKTLEKWVDDQKILGIDCKQALKAKGGAHDGVILQKVFNAEFTDSAENKQQVQKTKIGNTEIFLHGEFDNLETIGVGAFINSWCSEYRKDFITLSKSAHQEVFEEIKELLDSTLEDKTKESTAGKIIVSMSATLKTLKKKYGIKKEDGELTNVDSRETSKDRGSELDRRGTAQEISTEKANNYMHSMKTIRRAIARDVNISVPDAKKLYKTFDELNILRLSDDDMNDFYKTLHAKLGLSEDYSLSKQTTLTLSADEIKKIMIQSEQDSNSRTQRIISDTRVKVVDAINDIIISVSNAKDFEQQIYVINGKKEASIIKTTTTKTEEFQKEISRIESLISDLKKEIEKVRTIEKTANELRRNVKDEKDSGKLEESLKQAHDLSAKIEEIKQNIETYEDEAQKSIEKLNSQASATEGKPLMRASGEYLSPAVSGLSLDDRTAGAPERRKTSRPKDDESNEDEEKDKPKESKYRRFE